MTEDPRHVACPSRIPGTCTGILLVCSSTFVFTPFDTGTATGKVSGLSAHARARAAPRRAGAGLRPCIRPW